MSINLSELDATAQAELVSRGELRAIDLVDAAIARIEALEPDIHALASTNFELARARAQAEPKGAFGGVPLLAKDLLAVPGYRCEMGSRLFRGNVPAEGSPFTDRLEQAGFIILGKTTTSELGLLGSTETRAAGVTHNPWGRELSATGSSGGSAAAVAAGMVPMAHASDGGGLHPHPGLRVWRLWLQAKSRALRVGRAGRHGRLGGGARREPHGA